MDGWAKAGEPVRMNVAFRAATKDIIQAYAFGEGDKCLDKEDCEAAFFDISKHTVIPFWFFLSVTQSNHGYSQVY
ncbi:hypothetical protein PC116_g34383 [Phytophthora cactorum]|nr:hypothetical protein PC116_g34383 [Phytophthora cactorum]